MEDKYFISMMFRIWKIENDNGIFYYKIQNYNEYNNLFFNYGPNDKDCFFTKTLDNDIKCIEDHKNFNPEKGDKILFRIRKSFKSNIYEIINPIIELKISRYNCSNNYLNDKIWYPVKSSTYFEGNNQNYCLNENDVIKLGRKKYIVFKKHFSFGEEKGNIKDDIFNRKNNISYICNINKNSKSIFNIDISTNQYIINNRKYSIKNTTKNIQIINSDEINNENGIDKENENKNETDSESESENEFNKCRICFNSDSDINNPLICLCNCHNYIHYECLKMYLSSKLIITENFNKNVTTYRCIKFYCGICHKPYHLRFRIPEFNKTYELIDLTLPEETDYICLESLDFIKDNNNIKTLYIVQLIDEEITIGRQIYNDIIDNDISISRKHAVMRYNKKNGNLFLENRSEKFGTLVLVRGNIKIKEGKIYFQIGNTYISVEATNIKTFKNYDEEISNLILGNSNSVNYNDDYDKN